MKNNSCTLYDTVIFDRNNPNFEIKGENEAIERLFKDKFIPVIDDLENIIGFVKETGVWRKNKLHGDIWFWNIDHSDLDFKNYEVAVDLANENIVAVYSITYG